MSRKNGRREREKRTKGGETKVRKRDRKNQARQDRRAVSVRPTPEQEEKNKKGCLRSFRSRAMRPTSFRLLLRITTSVEKSKAAKYKMGVVCQRGRPLLRPRQSSCVWIQPPHLQTPRSFFSRDGTLAETRLASCILDKTSKRPLRQKGKGKRYKTGMVVQSCVRVRCCVGVCVEGRAEMPENFLSPPQKVGLTVVSVLRRSRKVALPAMGGPSSHLL